MSKESKEEARNENQAQGDENEAQCQEEESQQSRTRAAHPSHPRSLDKAQRRQGSKQGGDACDAWGAKNVLPVRQNL